MPDYAELEFGLHRHDGTRYSVDFRLTLPESEADIRLAQHQPALVEFDLPALQASAGDPTAYGKLLSQNLFGDPQVLSAFAQSRASAQAQGYPLRVRLLVGPSAPELHSLRWETLIDPDSKAYLFTGESLVFSRYLSSLDWRPVRLRPKGQLRALIAVANPGDLEQYSLAPIDLAGEIERARLGLSKIPVTILPGEGGRLTLENLAKALRNSEYDILYLVAHGALVREEPWLFLEDEQGQVKRIAGTDLVIQIKELPQRPRLVILASCQSAAGSPASLALSALGPRLAEGGIPAVVAMQGNVSMQTIQKFMPVFFEELHRDGQIDRAISVARIAVRQEPDFWMPALFMRLKSGRIWYTPGFGDERKGFEKWPALIRSIRKNQCTPIIGPGLQEDIIGSFREIAQRWAEAYHYPMAPHERESLPQVAQYLAINQDPLFPYDELNEYLKYYLREHYATLLSNGTIPVDATLDELLDKVGAAAREKNPTNPYRLLAQLPLPIFITTNLNNLLATALKEAKKDPQVVICPWNEYVEQSENIFTREPEYRPSVERPLVYHLYGRLDEPESIVLTEDNFFNFLIGVTSNRDLIPPVVRAALVNSALLFLGFQMDEWNFRVLFRTILALQGGNRRSLYAHIAAQIEPEEGRILEPERARNYLETYIAKGADVSLYWGSAEDFLKELLPRWAESSR